VISDLLLAAVLMLIQVRLLRLTMAGLLRPKKFSVARLTLSVAILQTMSGIVKRLMGRCMKVLLMS
jgi:hypothetical protein